MSGRQVSAARSAWTTREAWLRRDLWALGDWAASEDRAYGDLADAAAEIGIGAATLYTLACVARKIEMSRRRDNLSFAHHAEVASLPADTGDDLLDRAEAEGWSRTKMRAEARAHRCVGRTRRR